MPVREVISDLSSPIRPTLNLGRDMDYSERIDSLIPTRFGLSALPIYVARVPAAPFASGWRGVHVTGIEDRSARYLLIVICLLFGRIIESGHEEKTQDLFCSRLRLVNLRFRH